MKYQRRPHSSLSVFLPAFVWNSVHCWWLSVCLSVVLSECHCLIGHPSSSSSSSVPMGKYADTFWFDYGSQTKLCSVAFLLRQTDDLWSKAVSEPGGGLISSGVTPDVKPPPLSLAVGVAGYFTSLLKDLRSSLCRSESPDHTAIFTSFLKTPSLPVLL